MSARRLLAAVCLAGAAAGMGRPAQAGPINDLFRHLGLGWSDGYHARPPHCCWAPNGGAARNAPNAPFWSVPGPTYGAADPARGPRWTARRPGPTTGAASLPGAEPAPHRFVPPSGGG